MDLINVEQHKLIVEKCKELLIVSLKKDVDYLQNMINYSQGVINDHNNKKLTVIDITNLENGTWASTIKKVVMGKYINPIMKKINFNDLSEEHYKDFSQKKDDLRSEFKDACDKTVFSQDLKLKYILLNRKMEDKYNPEPLELALKNAIHTEILKTFQNQNQKLIIKYN